MKNFITPLLTQKISDDDFELISDFVYRVSDTHFITVPKGFRTDGASIPRAFWSTVGHPFEEYFESAVIHDYLYRKGIGTKKNADKIFLQAMTDQGVNPIKRKIMYYAVKMFGRGAW